MKYFRLVCSLLMLGSLLAYGQVTITTPEKTTSKAPDKPNELPPELQGRPPLSKQTRIELIRTLQAEFGFAKKLFPKGDKGLKLTSSGQISPDDQSIMMQVASNGPAAKPGDKLQITDVVIKGSEIVFDINGGSKRKGHWYDHIEVGGGGGMVPVHQEKGAANPGCTLALVFPKYVPEMTTADVKKLLEPVIDFSVKSPTQAYIDTLPPKLKTSIQNHEVLVGMSKEMVIDALGRPPKRIRESDGNVDYEEWMYGEPPAEVQFIRFVNEEVVRVEHSGIGEKPIIKTAREVKVNAVTGAATMIDPNAPQTAAAAQPEQPTQTAEAKKPPKAPTLRRAGEQPEDQKAAATMPGELGSKPIPAGGSTQEPEWGTKPAQTSGTAQTGTAQNPQNPTARSPDAPLPGAGSLPPVDPK